MGIGQHWTTPKDCSQGVRPPPISTCPGQNSTGLGILFIPTRSGCMSATSALYSNPANHPPAVGKWHSQDTRSFGDIAGKVWVDTGASPASVKARHVGESSFQHLAACGAARRQTSSALGGHRSRHLRHCVSWRARRRGAGAVWSLRKADRAIPYRYACVARYPDPYPCSQRQ